MLCAFIRLLVLLIYESTNYLMIGLLLRYEQMGQYTTPRYSVYSA